MSQKVINLSLQLFVFLAIFLVDVEISSFNITRHTTGDVFDNTNSSKSCNKSGASCVFDGDNSPFCGVNCCSCICPSQMPTYLLRNGNCTSEDHLLSILTAESAKQGCKYRMVVAESHHQCSKEVLTTLNTVNPGNKTLYLCPWKGSRFSLQHFTHVKDMLTCEIVPQESLYLNGSWQHRLQDDPALSRLKVKIGQDPDFDNDRLSLEWLADIGKEYDGLIFSLKLKCLRKGKKELHSCLHFKKGGSFTDAKPTSRPPAPIKMNPTLTTIVKQKKQEITTTGLPQTKEITLSTTHASTFGVRNGGAVSSSRSQPKVNLVIVILSALSGVLFVSLALLTLFILLSRRFRVRKGGETANNPVYARGSSDTLKMGTIGKENGQNTEKGLDCQPLVENTTPTERKDSLPGCLIVFADRRPNQQQTSNGDIRSSNYLSLLKEDTEDLREYQTLMKVVNPVLETRDEDKIPDYAEIEERTDSEDTSDSSDSQDCEEPLFVPPRGGKRRIVPRRQKLNDLSSEVNDYDEPEGIIVISDNEAETHDKAIRVINDFHDYGHETDVNCYVKRPEDLLCYHDYDDPE